MGRNFAQECEKNGEGNVCIRWKETRNENPDLMTNGGGCRDNLLECPLVKKYQATLRKNDFERIPSAKSVDGQICSKKTSKNEKSEKNQRDRDSRSASSNTLGSVRSTRAQDLRSRSNRDSMESKTVFSCCGHSSYSSPYAPKKKKNSYPVSGRSARGSRSAPVEKKKSGDSAEKMETASQGKGTKMSGKPRGHRSGTEESEPSTDSGGIEKTGPKKSATFFICKGPKKGRVDSALERKTETDSPDGSELETFSPKPKPITHNDSFCLIAKSSKNWYRKQRPEDDPKFAEYGCELQEKSEKKIGDKGILKNSNRDLKSVDSLEKMESEKIVRFSQDGPQEKRSIKKCIRRKRRLENVVNAAWYRRNKLFQKYLQVLKSKSILHSSQEATPRELRPFLDSPFMKDRYEAEMLGLVPRHQRSKKGKKKIPTEDDDLE